MEGAKYKEVKGDYEKFKLDFQTPPEVCKYMISLIPKGVKTILEPTPGIGNIKKELISGGYDVDAPLDFFNFQFKEQYDAIVMNPPFSHKFTNLENAPLELHKHGMKMGYWFLTECMKMAPTVVALMPWFTISDSDVRMRSLYRYGIKSITALPRKTFDFARIQTMVIHLEKGFEGQTIFYAYDCIKDIWMPKLELE